MLVMGRPTPGLQDQFVDDIAHNRIETGRRFVVKHHLGVENQGAGQPDPLFHAAGQFRRHFPLDPVRQPNFRQPLPDPVSRISALR